MELPPRTYQTIRFHLLFEKGFFFYAEYNLRLFFFLFFQKPQLLFSNDLDTLLPNFLISRIKSCALIYDSHEYYTETPELIHRSFVRSVWLGIESRIFPKLKTVLTVSTSIAEKYSTAYGVKVHVVRNIPRSASFSQNLESKNSNSKKIILYQGAGINKDRGVEELIEAMNFVENAELWIVGDGDVLKQLKIQAQKLIHEGKIIFKGKVSPEALQKITPLADLGISIDKLSNLNYRFSLPNKIFDYIHAGIPVLTSKVLEVEKLVRAYEIGDCIEQHDPKHIADKINSILNNDALRTQLKVNVQTAAKKLSWENEEKILLQLISNSKSI